MNMGHVVVVGYDGSDASRAALDWARRRVAPGGGLVVAVHAFGPPADWLGFPNYQAVLDEHRSRGEAILKELEASGDDDTPIETDLVAGAPAEVLAAVGRARDATEIVVGSRGFGPVRGAIGSVSHSLLHHADRPIVVVP